MSLRDKVTALAMIAEDPLEDLVHIAQRAFQIERMLQRFAVHLGGDLRIVHDQFAEIQVLFPRAHRAFDCTSR